MIPVYEPIINQGNEKKYLQKCIDTNWVSSDGYFVNKFEEEFAKWSGNKYAVAVCNGTAALETAIWSTGITGSIAIPNSTIISCAWASRNNDLWIRLYDDKYFAKNIIRCHLFGHWNWGVSGETIIDDCSQYWKPFKVQDIACYSLYANKLITSGEGGVIVTNRKDYYERAKLYSNLSHSKTRFVHKEVGYNFRMSNLQGAVALAQLEQIEKFTIIKQINRDLYKKYIPDNIEILFDVDVPWMYLVSTKYNASSIVNKLDKLKINCRRFFYPLHKQPCFRGLYNDLKMPKSDYAWEHYFYLPSGLTLKEKDIKFICKSLKNIL